MADVQEVNDSVLKAIRSFKDGLDAELKSVIELGKADPNLADRLPEAIALADRIKSDQAAVFSRA